ncbi:hypothetical protein B7463_g7766, partial [Scytalidium lignicola]
MASRTVDTFQGERVVWTTSSPYDKVLERLNNEIKRPGQSPSKVFLKDNLTKEEFISFYSEIQGPAGFMQFHEFDHGRWIKLFDVGQGLRLKRVILGNPLIAITMLRHDSNAGLCVPIELLIRELEDGKGTQLDQNLSDAVRVLDEKFEKLLEQITGDAIEP